MKKVKHEPNLMVDHETIKRICDHAGLKKTEKVLEIGAGTGNLTSELVKRSGFVYAIEKNRSLFSGLLRTFAGCRNIELINGDALRIPLPPCDKIVSNLPYGISRKITEKILGQRYDLCVLVYQKEYAEKLIAKPGKRNYRFISALAQSCAEMEILEIIPPKAFLPEPGVDSAIVRVRQKFIPEKDYVRFLHGLFDHRNKEARKLVKGEVPEGIKGKRPYELSAEELRSLYKIIRPDLL